MTHHLVRRQRAQLILLGALVCLFAGLFAGPAGAHALVNATFPTDGAVLDEPPTEVSLSFNEGVQAPTAGVRVYDDQGERVDVGDASVDPQDGTRIRAAVAPDLRDGTYIVTWRAVSADGHPIKGAFLFSVGDGDAVDDDLLASLFQSGGDRPLVALGVLVRAVAIGSTLLLAGLGLFSLVVPNARDGDGVDQLVGLATTTARVGVGASLASIFVQSMLETGLGLGAFAPGPVGDVVASPVGWSALLRAGLFAAVQRPLRQQAVIGRGAAALGVLAALTLALDGHSLTQDPIAVIFVGDLVHVLSAAAWGGGLVALGVLVRARRRADDPVGAARLVAGFSGLATWSLLALTVAGSAMGWVTVRAARALTSTGYGWTLIAKLSVVAVLVVTGLYNKRRLVPAVVAAGMPAGGAVDVDTGTEPDDGIALVRRVGDGAWVRLRQTLRLEAVLMSVVVLVTALLVGQQPASQEAGITGAFTTYADLTADLEVNLVVDPNRAGVNEIHLYLLERTGRPAAADEVTFVLEQPANDLGPFERTPAVSGPGHWSLVGRELAIAGEWNITIVVRTGRFAEERITIPVVVNR